jgi:hypothetical protein
MHSLMKLRGLNRPYIYFTWADSDFDDVRAGEDELLDHFAGDNVSCDDGSVFEVLSNLSHVVDKVFRVARKVDKALRTDAKEAHPLATSMQMKATSGTAFKMALIFSKSLSEVPELTATFFMTTGLFFAN